MIIKLMNAVEKEAATFAGEKGKQKQIRTSETYTEATNGAIAIKVTPHVPPCVGDYPVIDGHETEIMAELEKVDAAIEASNNRIASLIEKNIQEIRKTERLICKRLT